METNIQLLENLPNELWLEIFTYMKYNQIWHSFYNLNQRFEELIIRANESHGIPLQIFNEIEYARILEKHTQNIFYARISHHENDPNQIGANLRDDFELHRFIKLTKLTIDDVEPPWLLQNIFSQLGDLSNLTELRFKNFPTNHKNLLPKVLTIAWAHPTLKKIFIQTVSNTNLSGFEFRRVSQSLRFVELPNTSLTTDDTLKLLEMTPLLTTLGVCIKGIEQQNQHHKTYPLIKTIKLFNIKGWSATGSILKLMTNLERLQFQGTVGRGINGNFLKSFICNNLPHLNKLNFALDYGIVSDVTLSTDVSALKRSFSTKFWLNANYGHIRIDWTPYFPQFIVCYNLPSILDDFSPQAKSYKVMSFTNRTDTSIELDTFPELAAFCHMNFPNIKELELTLPIQENSYLLTHSFGQFTSLTVSLKTKGLSSNQLRTVLDHMPNLSTIIFSATDMSDIIECLEVCNGKTIETLDISRLNAQKVMQSLIPEQFERFVRTRIGSSCETLFVRLINMHDIRTLSDRLPHLRLLNAKCSDDYNRDKSFREINQEDIYVAHVISLFPANFCVKREKTSFGGIRIWKQ